MIILGIALIVLGYILPIPLLYTLGVLLLVLGIILWALGAAGHSIGGRRHYW
jgi:Family of unknown function (DUF6131)